MCMALCVYSRWDVGVELKTVYVGDLVNSESIYCILTPL
jgi:hypothetical protein